MFDVSPIFPLPIQWYHSTEALHGSQDCMASMASLRAAWTLEFPHAHDTEWLDIFDEIRTFSHDLFEGTMSTGAVAQCFAGDTGAWTNSMIHRLLAFRPNPHALLPKEFRVLEACRLGSLLYMIPIWRFLGVAPVASETLQAKLHAILKNDNGAWGQIFTLHLWLLYMGSVEALGGPFEAWFLDQVVSVSALNGVKTWEEYMAMVKELLWFACIFDTRHAALQEKMKLRLEQCTQ